MSDLALMTISSPGSTPDIERAAEILGVSSDAVDRLFGVVPINSAHHRYAVQVHASALSKTSSAAQEGPYQGPFSNPRIQGFGPFR